MARAIAGIALCAVLAAQARATAAQPAPAYAAELPAEGDRWTDADVRAALDGAPLLVRRIVYCEVGRSGSYDPYAIGGQGEIGPAQLLPGRGNGLAIFYGWGGVDPNSPYEARAFIEHVIAAGMIGSQYPRTSLGCEGSP